MRWNKFYHEGSFRRPGARRTRRKNAGRLSLVEASGVLFRKGGVLPQFSEVYTFRTRVDDGVRLWVNNQLIIDKITAQGANDFTGTIALSGGTRYPVKMEYIENTGNSSARLFWSSASQSEQVLPRNVLYAVPEPTPEITPAPTPFMGPTLMPPGDGLIATYFNNSDLTGQVFSGSILKSILIGDWIHQMLQ